METQASTVVEASAATAGAAVDAALRYRAQAPVVDGLMRELGLSGGSLDALVAGAAGAGVAPVVVAEPVTVEVKAAE